MFASDFGDLDIDNENDEPYYDINATEDTVAEDIFAEIKTDREEPQIDKNDDSCYDIDITNNTDNWDIFAGIKSNKDDSENDDFYYSFDQLASKVRTKLKLFKYDEDKFDKYLNALFEMIRETQKKPEYDLKFLKDELKKAVKRQVIDKNGKIKIKIKFLFKNYNSQNSYHNMWKCFSRGSKYSQQREHLGEQRIL